MPRAISRAEPVYTGFSERLNELLNEAKYPPLDYGRARALAEEFGVSKSGARRWLREDISPRLPMIQALVEKVSKSMGRYYRQNAEKTIAWLQYGEAAAPIDDEWVKHTDHILLSEIYVAVHYIAKRKKINLNKMPPKQLTKLYKTLIERATKDGLDSTEENFISSLLEIATGK